LGRYVGDAFDPIEAPEYVNGQLFLQSNLELDEHFGGCEGVYAEVGQRRRWFDSRNVDAANGRNRFLDLPFHVRHSASAGFPPGKSDRRDGGL
jgi:hypothetical protein